MRIPGLSIILGLILALNSIAQDVDIGSYYPQDNLIFQELSRTGELTRVLEKDRGLTLLPAISAYPVFNDALQEKSQGIGSESLFLIPLPERLRITTGYDRTLFILNCLADISSLEGIEYYSASRGKYRVLFTRARAIASPLDSSPVSEPVFTDLPADRVVYTAQTDTTFGESISRMSFHTENAFISLRIDNLTPLSLGPVKVVEKEGMNISLLVVPFEDNLLLYALGTIDSIKLGLFTGTLERSLYNRVKAMKEWLVSSLNAP